MSQFKAISMSILASVFLTLSLGLSSQAFAGHHEGKHMGKDKGPCAEIKCEKGDKFCYQKKGECRSKAFDKRIAEAKAKGVSADEKAKWVEKIQNKITHKKERLAATQSDITNMEAKLKAVQALKTK